MNIHSITHCIIFGTPTLRKWKKKSYVWFCIWGIFKEKKFNMNDHHWSHLSCYVSANSYYRKWSNSNNNNIDCNILYNVGTRFVVSVSVNYSVCIDASILGALLCTFRWINKSIFLLLLLVLLVALMQRVAAVSASGGIPSPPPSVCYIKLLYNPIV